MTLTVWLTNQTYRYFYSNLNLWQFLSWRLSLDGLTKTFACLTCGWSNVFRITSWIYFEMRVVTQMQFKVILKRDCCSRLQRHHHRYNNTIVSKFINWSGNSPYHMGNFPRGYKQTSAPPRHPVNRCDLSQLYGCHCNYGSIKTVTVSQLFIYWYLIEVKWLVQFCFWPLLCWQPC